MAPVKAKTVVNEREIVYDVDQQGKKVSLQRLVQIETNGKKGWRRRPVPLGKHKGWRDRLDFTHESFGLDVVALGQYELMWYVKGKERYQRAGDTCAEACAALNQRCHPDDAVEAEAAPVEVVETPYLKEPRRYKRQLEKAVAPVVAKRVARGKITSDETCRIYHRIMTQFCDLTFISNIEEVTEAVMVKYLAAMRRRKAAANTMFNSYGLLMSVLVDLKPELRRMLKENAPKAPEPGRVSYTEEEIDELLDRLSSRTRYRRLTIIAELFYKTGLREGEATYLTYDKDSLDLEKGHVWVKARREFRLTYKGEQRDVLFQTKTRKDRKVAIPLEEGLLTKLRTWRKLHPNDRFVFQTKTGNPDRGMLRKLRRAVARLGLTCGECPACKRPCRNCIQCRCGKCKNCRMKRPNFCTNPHFGVGPCTRIECHKWKLHTFRHTYASEGANSPDMPLSMVQHTLGHGQLTTTEKYISPATAEAMRTAVNKVYGRKRKLRPHLVASVRGGVELEKAG